LNTTAHKVELEKVEPEKVHLEFAEISRRLRELKLPNVDAVIGIGRGGVVPASMVAHQLGVPLHVLRVIYRDDDNKPRSSAPRLLEEFHWSQDAGWSHAIYCKTLVATQIHKADTFSL
jgi:hypoxanthine phosphoribosyltransferase